MVPSPEEKNILQELADLQVAVETADPATPEYAALKDAYDKQAEKVARQFPAFQTLYKLYLADARAKRRSMKDAEETDAKKKEEKIADDTEALRKALGNSNPVMQIDNALRSCSPSWTEEKRTPMRAYIFACLSELVYLRIGKYELKDRDRYKLFPSDLLEKSLTADMTADVDTAIRGATDIPVTSTDTGNFVFLTFNLPCYTVIAVRGTTPYLNDWAIDLDERKIKVDQSLGYHFGFYEESKTAAPLLLETVSSPTNPLFFTGHSLGGAVASILPQIWKGPQPLMIPYAFASPRFGNEAVANKYKVYAYVRGLDPVPHLPPEASGFRSSGWPPSMVPPTDEWASGADLLLNWRKLLAAHKIEGYRCLLGKEVSEDGFDPDVYLKLLKTRLDITP